MDNPNVNVSSKSHESSKVDYYAAQRFWAKHQKYHTTNLCPGVAGAGCSSGDKKPAINEYGG